MDPEHPKHEPGSPFEHVIRDYYRFVDCKIGELLQEVPEDAAVLRGFRPRRQGDGRWHLHQ